MNICTKGCTHYIEIKKKICKKNIAKRLVRLTLTMSMCT